MYSAWFIARSCAAAGVCFVGVFAFQDFLFEYEAFNRIVDFPLVLIQGDTEGNRVFDDIECLPFSLVDKILDACGHSVFADPLVRWNEDVIFVLCGGFVCLSFICWEVVFQLRVGANSCHLCLVQLCFLGVSAGVPVQKSKEEGVTDGVDEGVGDDVERGGCGDKSLSL